MIGMPPQTTAASKAHESPVRIHSIFLPRRPVTIHVSQKIRDYRTTTTKFLKFQQIIRASNPNKREHRFRIIRKNSETWFHAWSVKNSIADQNSMP